MFDSTMLPWLALEMPSFWSVFWGWHVVAAAASFAAYGLDKGFARLDWWRISERTLHVIDVLGGWPGGLAGQRVWRHKRRKVSFMRVFWVTVVVHVVVAGAVVWLRR